MIAVIRGVSFDTDEVNYFTAQDNGTFIIMTNDEEIVIQHENDIELQLSLDWMLTYFHDSLRFDFEGWYFIKSYFVGYEFSPNGVAIQTQAGEVKILLDPTVIPQAEQFLQEITFLI